MPFRELKLNRQPSEAQKELSGKLMSEVSSSKYRAVSFKLSDVLATTPFYAVSDMFTLMEEDFAALGKKSRKSFYELRTEAEAAAVKKYEIRVRVDLDKIYTIFAKTAGLSDDEKKQLMERECSLIEKYAIPRECVRQLYRKAKNCGKRVIVTAETIYPAATVEAILENCGYSSYDGLVIVSDIKNCTAESYYGAVLEKAGVKPDKLLHIGGDVAFDIELPIIKGSKAMLIAPPSVLMNKAGRIRDYCEDKDIFGYSEAKCFGLRCAFGLYSLYGFDTPQNKTALSDFCGDEYMLGFITLGALSLSPESRPQTKVGRAVTEALEKNEKCLRGLEDFKEMYEVFFGDIRDISGNEGCQYPLDFVEGCCSASDRKMLESYIPAQIYKKWGSSVKEPEIVRFTEKKPKQNAASRLADKMFPPGTKVRSITDSILSKGRKKLH